MAYYLEFEKQYNIQPYVSHPIKIERMKYLHPSPNHALTEEYAMENVKEPTDYVVLDHSRVDADLAKREVSSILYWNIWRLTPKAYQSQDGKWYFKDQCDLMASDFLVENAHYVFESTVNVIMQSENYKRNIKKR